MLFNILVVFLKKYGSRRPQSKGSVEVLAKLCDRLLAYNHEFETIEDFKRYEKYSTIVTSNQQFSKWGEVLSDATLASAILDRLLHVCSFCENIKDIIGICKNAYLQTYQKTTKTIDVYTG